jgi:site-specific recombinase XerD
MTEMRISRRHTASCPHREKGRDFLKCSCPLLADGYSNGRRTLRVSLKTRDYGRAVKRAAKLDEPNAPVLKPLDDAIAAYLVNCQHLNENTQRKYRNRLKKQLLPFCQSEGVNVVSEVTMETLDKFRAGRKLAITTSGRELETLRQFLSFCLDRRWISENPAKKIRPPRNTRPAEVVPYTADQVAKIITATGLIGKSDYERLRARAAILLLRHAALRISDVGLLERSRVQDGALLLSTKKTGSTVLLPLPDEMLAALEELPVPRGADPADSRYFFINGTGSARTAISVMERCLRSVFKASGVADAHAHRFRHTMATDILANGGTLADVADILSISETVAAKHYAKWNQARQDRIAALMRVMRVGTNRARRKKLVVIAS